MMISSAPFCRCRRRPVGILNVATSSLPLLCRAGETEVAGSSRHWSRRFQMKRLLPLSFHVVPSSQEKVSVEAL
ncbi:hypothetical protein EJB05_57739, partial [Eragrostis curvula]